MSIQDFAILSKLGEGAYSSVYKVERHFDKSEYALKKVKLKGLSDKQIQNAVNEVRILASIKNNNIVSYKEAFLEGKNLCIIMEYADAGDLYQQILQHKKRQTFFHQRQIWNVFIQTSRGLKALHDLKISHRDLKSANIFITKKGEIKLGDMNVSKIAKNGLLYTQTGTPYYASPEVWKDQPYDFKSDIWSFGCIMYEMITLQPPFKGEDMESLFQSILKGYYPPIPSFYSRQLATILSHMLQQNPTHRPTIDKLINSAIFLKKASELKLNRGEESSQLLRTIRIPKKLHYLTDRLPKSNYNDAKSEKGSENKRFSEQKLQRRESTLPKLQNIIRYHQQLIRKKDEKIRKRNSSLEVERIRKNYSNDIKYERRNIINGEKPNKQSLLEYYRENLLPPLRK